MSSSLDVYCSFWILKTIYYLLLIILLCSSCILEITFQPIKKLPLEYFGFSLCSALKGAEQVVEAACATCSSCKLGLEPWCLSQCICFNVFLIDIFCYNLLFINLQETVNETGKADYKLLCDNYAIKGEALWETSCKFHAGRLCAAKEHHLFLYASSNLTSMLNCERSLWLESSPSFISPYYETPVIVS